MGACAPLVVGLSNPMAELAATFQRCSAMTIPVKRATQAVTVDHGLPGQAHKTGCRNVLYKPLPYWRCLHMKHRNLFAWCLALSLAACAGTMTHMTTYGGAARSFAKEGCGQFCWSRHRPASNDEISGASTGQPSRSMQTGQSPQLALHVTDAKGTEEFSV